nr:hypothetical protein [Actinoplanes polyasparticus]
MSNVQQHWLNCRREWKPTPHTVSELAGALNRPYKGRTAGPGAR